MSSSKIAGSGRCRRRKAASTSCASGATMPHSMPAMRGRGWRRWKSGVAERHVTVERLEAMVAEVTSRLDKLKGQIEGAAAEKEQREQENVAAGRTGSRSGQRNAMPRKQRDRELQEELQAVRVRLAELEEALKTARHRTRRGARPARRIVGGAGAVAVRRAAHG